MSAIPCSVRSSMNIHVDIKYSLTSIRMTVSWNTNTLLNSMIDRYTSSMYATVSSRYHLSNADGFLCSYTKLTDDVWEGSLYNKRPKTLPTCERFNAYTSNFGQGWLA